VLSIVLDAALILLFVAIGRRSHDESSALIGFATTAWPFLVGAAMGWVVVRAWRRPTALTPTGVVVWAAAVMLGVLLRLVSGQGVQPSFVVVTAVVLALFLIGWRAVALLVTRRQAPVARAER
jgi:carbon starvation protein CstA